jgi:HAD superfamily hydrolase (TIGR01484 family)
VREFDLKETGFGPLIEDRGSQITLSCLGQRAPIEAKQSWDPEQEKRKKMVTQLKKEIPKFEIRIGGTTSIDITKKGLDKAYAIGKIEELLKVKDDDIIFVGDALYPGGNDEAVKHTGVDFIQEDGPDATLEFLSRYM